MNNEKISWIDINLPWAYDDVENYPKYPDLSQKEKEHFGISLEESRKKVEPYWNHYRKIQEEISDLLDADFKELEDEARDLKEEELWKNYENDPQVVAVQEHRKFVKIVNKWLNQQPEVFEYNEKRNIINQENKQKSFTGRGLNKPGTLIELENRERYLIGDINQLRGLCDDCTAFDSNVIVKRYAVLLSNSWVIPCN